MRIMHTMIRVGNLERSMNFYKDVLGMQVLRKTDFPEGKFTIVFMGYASIKDSAVLELTHNWDTTDYDLGNGYGHIAIEVDDVYKACEDIKNKGGEITREAGPMKHGTTVIAFAKDPDGYAIELVGDMTD